MTECAGQVKAYYEKAGGGGKDSGYWDGFGNVWFLCDRHAMERRELIESEWRKEGRQEEGGVYALYAAPGTSVEPESRCGQSTAPLGDSSAGDSDSDDLSDAVWLDQPLVVEDRDFEEFRHSEHRQGGPFLCRVPEVPDELQGRAFVKLERRSRSPLILEGKEYEVNAFVEHVSREAGEAGYVVTLSSPVLTPRAP